MQRRAVILGGAASGKSAHAERLVESWSPARLYVATAQAWDEEMAVRIRRHRDRRGAGWRTLEAPRDVAGALAQAREEEATLLDCATLWLSNAMLDEGAALAAETDALMAALGAHPGPVAVVSNELGLGLVPDTALGRRFRDAQGALNQRLAAWAESVVLVVAGLPMGLK